MLRLYKKFFSRFIIVFFIAISFAARFIIFEPWSLRRFRAWWTSQCSKWLLKVFNVQLEFHGFEKNHPSSGRMLVSNHLSYIDILLIGSRAPCIFVTSTDTEAEKGVGLIAKLGGCLFVDRNRPAQMRNELREIAEALKKGFCVVVFPEATTGDGSSLLSFKRALFQAAVLAEAPVDVACINYLELDGARVSRLNRDLIFYYGNMKFSEHFSALASIDKLKVELRFLGTKTSRESRSLCAKALQMIESSFKSVA